MERAGLDVWGCICPDGRRRDASPADDEELTETEEMAEADFTAGIVDKVGSRDEELPAWADCVARYSPCPVRGLWMPFPSSRTVAGSSTPAASPSNERRMSTDRLFSLDRLGSRGPFGEPGVTDSRREEGLESSERRRADGFPETGEGLGQVPFSGGVEELFRGAARVSFMVILISRRGDVA